MSRFDLSVKATKSHLAQELGIARLSLYYCHKQSAKDRQTKIEIENTLSQKPYNSYGHKRLVRHLKINKKRVLRVMKLFDIKALSETRSKILQKARKTLNNLS